MKNIHLKKIMMLLKQTSLMALQACTFLLLSLPALGAKNTIDPLTQLWQSLRSPLYIAPNQSQQEYNRDLFARVFADKLKENTIKEHDSAGLQLAYLQIRDQQLIILHEPKNALAGGGLYVFRENGNGVLLQATHAFKDLHTGKIAIKMMLEGNYSGLAINTVPRFYSVKNIRQDADMAHMKNSNFISFSLAFARNFAQGQIVQLHGFNNKSRQQTQDTAMIVSAGVKTTDNKLTHQASCLSALLEEKVLTYPSQINILGGTTNTIGRAVRRIGFSGFRHFEMSFPLRKKLMASKALRDGLSHCIKKDNPKKTLVIESVRELV